MRWSSGGWGGKVEFVSDDVYGLDAAFFFGGNFFSLYTLEILYLNCLGGFLVGRCFIASTLYNLYFISEFDPIY